MTDMNLDNAPGWLPSVGDVLVGEVVDVARGWSEYKEAYYPIVTIRPEGDVRVRTEAGDKEAKDLRTSPDGLVSGVKTVELVAVHAFHTVLYQRMVELRPEVGERIGIKYVAATAKTGKKGKEANSPALYNVKIEGRSADVWDTMEQDPRLIAAKAKNARIEREPYDLDERFPEGSPQDDEEIPF